MLDSIENLCHVGHGNHDNRIKSAMGLSSQGIRDAGFLADDYWQLNQNSLFAQIHIIPVSGQMRVCWTLWGGSAGVASRTPHRRSRHGSTASASPLGPRSPVPALRGFSGPTTRDVPSRARHVLMGAISGPCNAVLSTSQIQNQLYNQAARLGRYIRSQSQPTSLVCRAFHLNLRSDTVLGNQIGKAG